MFNINYFQLCIPIFEEYLKQLNIFVSKYLYLFIYFNNKKNVILIYFIFKTKDNNSNNNNNNVNISNTKVYQEIMDKLENLLHKVNEEYIINIFNDQKLNW